MGSDNQKNFFFFAKIPGKQQKMWYFDSNETVPKELWF